MEWIALSIAFLGTIYFTIRHRGFRRAVLYTGVGLGALALVAGVIGWYLDAQYEEKKRIAKTLIKPEQLDITDAKLSLGSVPQLSAMVTNKSPYELDELHLKVTVTDCRRDVVLEQQDTDGRKCGIVGENIARDWSINIPSGQQRVFSGYVFLENLPQLRENKWSWQYTIVEIIAKH